MKKQAAFQFPLNLTAPSTLADSLCELRVKHLDKLPPGCEAIPVLKIKLLNSLAEQCEKVTPVAKLMNIACSLAL